MFARELLGTEEDDGMPLPMIFTCNPMRTFIEGLALPTEAKQRLLELTPGGYVGLAEGLAREI